MPIRPLLFALTFALTANVHASTVTSLINVFKDAKEFAKVVVTKDLMKKGSEEISELSESLDNALKSLAGKKVTEAKVKTALTEIASSATNKQDKADALNALKTLKDYDKNSITTDKLRDLVNKITKLASRYGKNGHAVPECLCSKGGTDIAQAGIETLLKELTDPKAKKAARELKDMGAEARMNFVQKGLKDLYGAELPTSVDELPVDVEFALALLVKLSQDGGRVQKEFITGLENLMKDPDTGKIDFFSNGQIIYQALARNNTADFMKSYTKLLQKAADERAMTKQLSAQQAFESVLREKAVTRNANGELVENEALMSKVDYVIKNCPKFTK